MKRKRGVRCEVEVKLLLPALREEGSRERGRRLKR